MQRKQSVLAPARAHVNETVSGLIKKRNETTSFDVTRQVNIESFQVTTPCKSATRAIAKVRFLSDSVRVPGGSLTGNRYRKANKLGFHIVRERAIYSLF
jgi:hypothetical protein